MSTLPVKNRRGAGRARKKIHALRGEEKIEAKIRSGTDIAPILKPLTEAELVKIHRSALDLLAEVGMDNPTPRVLETALKHGCSVTQKGRLQFPRSLVEDMIDLAAKTFIVYARDSKFDWEARCGRINFCTGGAAVTMLDLESREYRPSTLADLYDLARLCDTLENIQWVTRPVVATDIQDLFELDVNTVYALSAGTQKHIATSFTDGENVYKMLPMLDALAGGTGLFAHKPFCTVHATNVVSPLAFSADSLDVTCAALDIGMPIHSQTGPQAGATAPAALAGTLVQGVAESLASLSVINMLKPGHPVVIGNWVFVSDLRTGAFSGGGGEQALLGAGAGQMSMFYGIPGGVGAGMTDSKLPDNQAGFEKALTLMSASLSGGGLAFESAGMLASLLGCSHESMVIDNEMLSCLHRIARGIEVTDESLSVSVVTDAVNGPGHFLGHDQTMELMHSEFVYPKYADRSAPEDWEQSGAKDIWNRATARVKEVLCNHHPLYINRNIDASIRERFPIYLHPVR